MWCTTIRIYISQGQSTLPLSKEWHASNILILLVDERGTGFHVWPDL